MTRAPALVEEQGAHQAAQERFAVISATLASKTGRHGAPMQVAVVGSGAGVQCRLWAERGHQVYGAGIDEALIAMARKRSREAGLHIAFEVASATALPWPDRSMDLCIVSELAADVADWRACLAEFVRILRPGGALYLNTINVNWWTWRRLRKHFVPHGLAGLERSDAFDTAPRTILTAIKPAF